MLAESAQRSIRSRYAEGGLSLVIHDDPAAD